MTEAGLVLEGGATRGIFTAGALDYLMEKNLYVSYVAGVSAGSCNAVDYISKQIERTKNCILPREGGGGVDWRGIWKRKSMLDMDLLFDRYPNEIFPFDYETYSKSPIKAEIVVTNCLTGKAEYLDERHDKKKMLQIVRASSSMPIISPIVEVDGIPYMDGGLADSVPIRRAISQGNKKIILILTRRAGYRKKERGRFKPLYKAMYRQYPNLVSTICSRPKQYNKTMDLIEKLEREGKIFVLRPRIPEVSRLETDYDAVMRFYRHGYIEMRKNYEKLKEYLNLNKG